MARLIRQAAVIPYRIRKRRIEMALVTTPGGKRWVVPKGSIDEDELASDAAIRETEEEAGLLGDLRRKPLGRYRVVRRDARFRVDVFLMRVTVVLDYWMESKLRHRRWMAVDEAAAAVREEVRPLIRAAERLIARNHGRAAGREKARKRASD
jgi:8-oxo-dGTP pyrophosphatase MutT (NUDIX family)